MSWSSFTKNLSSASGLGNVKLPNALPSFEELKKSVDTGVKAANSSFQDAAHAAREAAKEAADAAKDVAGQVRQVKTSDELLSKVRGVFDLDALQQREGGPARPGVDDFHFQEQDVTYITDRLIVMGFPESQRTGRTLGSVARLLNTRHGDDYMIWNLSEKQYDCQAFKGQVIDYNFPGYPAPPIAMLFKLCMSVEAWLNSAPANVAVVHCMTGRGRSITVAACLLEWIGKASNARDSLLFACRRRQALVDQALVPTQLRYVDMFHTILTGTRPRYDPLCLKRITVHGVPNMFSSQDSARSDLPSNGGCRPYMQVYKNGKLLFTTVWADQQSETGTKVFKAGATESFTLESDCIVDGDILLRVRHVDTTTGKGSSMFRYGFHTGYVPCGTLSLRRNDLDGASVDPRFAEDLVVELEFEQAKASDPDSQADMFDAAVGSKTSFWDEIDKKKTLADSRRAAGEQDSLFANEEEKQAVAELAAAGPSAMRDSTSAAAVAKAVNAEFSIDDDDDDDLKLGSSAATAGPGQPGTAAATESGGGESIALQDELAALSMLDADDTDAPAPADAPADAPAAAPADAPADAPAAPAADATLDQAMAPEGEGATAQAAQSPGAAPAAAVAGSGSDDPFMDELDAIEMDLGLDADGGETKGTTMTKADPDAGPPSASSEDPDLAELEKYLEGL